MLPLYRSSLFIVHRYNCLCYLLPQVINLYWLVKLLSKRGRPPLQATTWLSYFEKKACLFLFLCKNTLIYYNYFYYYYTTTTASDKSERPTYYYLRIHICILLPPSACLRLLHLYTVSSSHHSDAPQHTLLLLANCTLTAKCQCQSCVHKSFGKKRVRFLIINIV